MATVAIPAHTASAAAPLSYYGGPVAHAMTGVIVDWGPSVNPAYRDNTNGDPGLLNYWASQSGSPLDINGVLSQYMDTSGHNSQNRVGYGGQYQITPSNPSPALTDGMIQDELVAQINGGHVPRPGGDWLGTVYMVLLPPGDTVCLPQGTSTACSGVDFCAYHNSIPLTNGGQLLYAVLADNFAAGSGCGENPDRVRNETQAFSHEWAETINDPLVGEVPSQIGPPLAWYDTSPSAGGEVADKCDPATASNGQFTVEPLWSNREGSCVSAEPASWSPTATFSVGGEAHAGQPLAFDGRSSTASATASAQDISTSPATALSIPAGIANFSWHWDDGKADSTGATPAHRFARPGTYEVTLTVTDNLGFTAATTQQVTVGHGTTPSGRRPKVKTGAASARGTTVTLRARVDPHGLPTHFHFEFGRTKRYGKSSGRTLMAAGTKSHVVRVKLTGLSPHTRFHFRIVASNARGTSVGRDRRFRTGRAARHAPMLRLLASGQHLAQTLRSGLRVRFSCSAACDVQLLVTQALSGLLGRQTLAIAIARGSASLRHRGAGVVTLRFDPAARRRLAREKRVRLIVAGAAATGPDTPATPASAAFTLRR